MRKVSGSKDVLKPEHTGQMVVVVVSKQTFCFLLEFWTVFHSDSVGKLDNFARSADRCEKFDKHHLDYNIFVIIRQSKLN